MKTIALKRIGFAVLALAGACFSSAAFAGGPLYVYDPTTRTPYTWPLGQATVYTDLGTLGPLSNSEADAMTAFSWGQWNQVPNSKFHATIAGDFASIGLPDIDASNIWDVLEKWNGGGIHVVYDADGSIFESLFGFSGGVLGITVIEFVPSMDSLQGRSTPSTWMESWPGPSAPPSRSSCPAPRSITTPPSPMTVSPIRAARPLPLPAR